MPAATAAMPSSASPRPAPSSASRSGTTSAPGSLSPETQPSPTSRNSSLSVAQQPNPPGLLPLLPKKAAHRGLFHVALSHRRYAASASDDTVLPQARDRGFVEPEPVGQHFGGVLAEQRRR